MKGHALGGAAHGNEPKAPATKEGRESFKKHRAEWVRPEGFRAATVAGCIYAAVTGALLATVGKYLTYLFVSRDAALIIGYIDTYLKCVGIFFVPLTFVNVYRNGLQGMGYGLLPMAAGIAELMGRGAVALVAAHYSGYLGVCPASPAAWILADILLLTAYPIVLRQQEAAHRGDHPAAQPLPQRA